MYPVYENTWYIKGTNRGLPTFSIGFYNRGFWQPVVYSFDENHANLILTILIKTAKPSDFVNIANSNKGAKARIIPENYDIDNVIWENETPF